MVDNLETVTGDVFIVDEVEVCVLGLLSIPITHVDTVLQPVGECLIALYQGTGLDMRYLSQCFVNGSLGSLRVDVVQLLRHPVFIERNVVVAFYVRPIEMVIPQPFLKEGDEGLLVAVLVELFHKPLAQISSVRHLYIVLVDHGILHGGVNLHVSQQPLHLLYRHTAVYGGRGECPSELMRVHVHHPGLAS